MRGPWFLRYVLDEEGGQLCRRWRAQDVEFIVEDEVKSSAAQRPVQRDINGKHSTSTADLRRGLDYYTEPVRDTASS